MEEAKTTVTTATKKFSLTSAGFLAGVLLFLLPFVEIKCNGQTFATNSGIGLAFGTDYKTTEQTKSPENSFDDNERKTTERQKGKLYISALLALIAGLAGFILSLTTGSKPNKILVFAAGLAAICLIALMIQIQMDVKEKPVSGGGDTLGTNLKVTAEFTAWYYLSLLCFIIAAVLSYRKKPLVIQS